MREVKIFIITRRHISPNEHNKSMKEPGTIEIIPTYLAKPFKGLNLQPFKGLNLHQCP